MAANGFIVLNSKGELDRLEIIKPDSFVSRVPNSLTYFEISFIKMLHWATVEMDIEYVL